MPILQSLRGRDAMHRRFAVFGFGLLTLMALVTCLAFMQVVETHEATHAHLTERVPATMGVLELDTELHQAQLALVSAAHASSTDERRQAITRYEQHVDQALDRFNAVAALPASGDRMSVLEPFKSARVGWLQAGAALVDTLERSEAPAPGAARLARLRKQFRAMREPIERLESRFQDPLAQGAAIEADNRFHTRVLLGVIAAGMCTGLGVTGYYFRVARRRRLELEARDTERAAETRRRHFEARVANALSMTSDEPGTLRLMADAIDEAVPETPTEILLADSSQAHLRQVATTDRENGGPGCPVSTPSECPAVQRGHELRFESSEGFDVCPHLRGRPSGNCSAVCVPLSIMGQAVGVVHATRAPQDPPDEEQTTLLTTITSKASERLGMVRAFRQTKSQAATDPLTGLTNRRALESQIRKLQERDSAYAVAYLDLDHFKQLNDTHGHDTGDRALRLFTRVLRDAIRPADIACRWGGEEFVVILPRANATQTEQVMQRLRDALAEVHNNGHTPGFTVSVGVSDTTSGHGFEDILARADAALMHAKQAGRDRVVIADETMASSDASASLPEQADPASPTGRHTDAVGDALSQMFHADGESEAKPDTSHASLDASRDG